jgi:hypothetical protein
MWSCNTSVYLYLKFQMEVNMKGKSSSKRLQDLTLELDADLVVL